MKTILIYGPDEEPNARLAVNAMRWWSVVYDLDQWLRAQVKYDQQAEHVEYLRALEVVRDRLHALMRDEGIALEDMP